MWVKGTNWPTPWVQFLLDKPIFSRGFGTGIAKWWRPAWTRYVRRDGGPVGGGRDVRVGGEVRSIQCVVLLAVEATHPYPVQPFVHVFQTWLLCSALGPLPGLAIRNDLFSNAKAGKGLTALPADSSTFLLQIEWYALGCQNSVSSCVDFYGMKIQWPPI